MTSALGRITRKPLLNRRHGGVLVYREDQSLLLIGHMQTRLISAAGNVTVYQSQPVAPYDQINTLGAIKIIAG